MDAHTVGQIVQRLDAALPAQRPVALHEPLFEGNEWSYVKECIDTGWVSSVGAYVDRFERDLAAYTGSTVAVAAVNGTAALHAALQLAGVRPHDEVLLPALTFVATANAVTYCGAIPHFVDIEERTLGLDPFALGNYLTQIGERRSDGCYNRNTGRRIGAIIPMHTFGHPVDMEPLVTLASAHGIPIVEDAAESLGSLYRGVHTGNFGTIAALSFNGNKIITSGAGGALITNDSELGKHAKHLTTTAKLPHPWDYVHDEVGYNYRLPNLNAALGVAQLERLEEYIARKRQLAEKYQKLFGDIPGMRIFKEPDFARSNYWLNCLILDQADTEIRDQLLQQTHERGILTRPAWRLMHRLSMYDNCPRMALTTAESLADRVICLPSSVALELQL